MHLVRWLGEAREALLHTIYPHHCLGCQTHALHHNAWLCAQCVHQLPATHFHQQAENLLFHQLGARMPIAHATAIWYFGKAGPLHHLIEAIKYRHCPEAGIFLGMLMAPYLQQYTWFAQVDALVPLPLNERKQLARGYNQAEKIAAGIASVTGLPVLPEALVRSRFTETQTRQNRSSRWQNMQEVFAVAMPTAVEGKHILLIDDVVTTGATLESCGRELLKLPGLRLSVATAGFTSHNA